MTTRIIAITGGSGAGKTTIARALAANLGTGAVVIGEDDYYRCASSIAGFHADTHNFDAPSAKDDALLAAHLAAAREGRPFNKPVYDLTTHTRAPTAERVERSEFVIVEGIHLLAFAELRALIDLAVFIEADESLRLARRMIRDFYKRGRTLESVQAQFFANVRPMHEAHIAPQRAFADLVLVSTPEAGEAEAAAHAEVIAARLAALG